MRYKRQAFWALTMMLIVMVAAAVIAFIDPFNTEQIWGNWIGLTIGGLVGILVSLSVAIETLPDEKDFFSLWGWTFAGGAFLGTFVMAWLLMGAPDSLKTIAWMGHFAMLIMYMINGLVVYLAYESPLEQKMKQLTSTP